MRRITIGGHPLHPATVHAPIGLLGTAFIWDALGIWRGEPVWWEISYWTLLAGVVLAGPALLSGFLDYLTLPEQPALMRDANRHMTVMLLAASVFLVRLLLQSGSDSPLGSSRFTLILLSAGGTLLLLAGGWLGGSLVYRHGAGRDEGDARRSGGVG
jgi:uncharacterized membrane protein